ncbi:putative Fe-S cluster [Gilliamella apicola SCGC AB-598-B02]|nr:putative Fe-S cluster [Gilliamella apicola SCGC AB-598-B02]
MQKRQNKSYLSYEDVRAFRCDNTILQATKEKIAKERAKYDNLLDLEKERQFLEEDKADYNAILESISNFSQDYFYYLTWLFGYEGCSEYAPKSINKFNDCEFCSFLEGKSMVREDSFINLRYFSIVLFFPCDQALRV